MKNRREIAPKVWLRFPDGVAEGFDEWQPFEPLVHQREWPLERIAEDMARGWQSFDPVLKKMVPYRAETFIAATKEECPV